MKRPNTWFVIADGGRARFITRRSGAEVYDTRREFVSAHLHTPSREIGDSRPGRGHESASSTRHAVQPRLDPHLAYKRDFVRAVADELNEAGRKGEFDRLVLVAPVRALGALVDALDDAIVAKVAARIRKDLTRVPDSDMASHLTDLVPH